MKRESLERDRRERDGGTVLLLALVVLLLLGALGGAQVAVAKRNIEQADYFLLQSELFQYAESGVALAIHDFDNFISGSQGNIGTDNWSEVDDVGADGLPGTLDEGEQDGMPTPGEPNLAPAPIGPASLGGNLLVTVYPTPYVGVFRIVSTCFADDGAVTVERVYRNELADFEIPAPIYANPDVQIVLGEDAHVLLDSNDHLLDGGAGEGAAVPGLVTEQGSKEGDNLFGLLAQLTAPALAPADDDDHADELYAAGGIEIRGLDSSPSVGEYDGMSFTAIFDSFRGKATRHLAPGSYVDPDLGVFATSDDMDALDESLMGEDVETRSMVTMLQSMNLSDGVQDYIDDMAGLVVVYVDGDLKLSGELGRGLLVVNGSLSLSGPAKFDGVIVVRGDVRLAGGPDEGITIHGGLMMDGAFLELTGKTSILYSSELLKNFKSEVRNYTPLFYTEHND